MISLDTVSSAEFEACLQEIFHLVVSDGKFPFTLSQVSPLGTVVPEAKRTPFSVTFLAATPIRLPQAIYRLENEKLGTLDVFLVQISPTEVEAVFN